MIGYELMLLVIGAVWLAAAAVFDVKTKEVPNWLNFSLLIIALAFRALYSVMAWDYWPFVNGIIGAGVFFLLANIFYYSGMFGGGDAKLLMALGAVIGVSYGWQDNFINYLIFVLLFLIVGFVYGVLMSAALIAKNWKKKGKEIKKEFSGQYKSKKVLFLITLLTAVVVLGMLYKYNLFDIWIAFPVVIALAMLPLMWVYARTIENTLMVKKVLTDNLREGDWLYRDVELKNGGVIKSNFDGLTKSEV